MSIKPGTSVTSTTLTIECGPRTAYVHDEKARALLRRAGVTQCMKDPHRRGVWMCPISALWDVIAVAEKVQRREVNLVEVSK